jgi:hypothetical protein
MGRAMLAMPRRVPPVVVVVVLLVVGWPGNLGEMPPAGSCSEDAILTGFWDQSSLCMLFGSGYVLPQ